MSWLQNNLLLESINLFSCHSGVVFRIRVQTHIHMAYLIRLTSDLELNVNVTCGFCVAHQIERDVITGKAVHDFLESRTSGAVAPGTLGSVALLLRTYEITCKR